MRAPLTRIVLIIEMTAAFTLLLPLLGACFAAMLIPTLLRDVPLERCAGTLRRRRRSGATTPAVSRGRRRAGRIAFVEARLSQM